jgi:hypothetical protein
VYDSGGLGKSRIVLRTPADEEVSPVMVNNHVSPVAMYACLYHIRTGSDIFFDDVDSIFSSQTPGSFAKRPSG